MQDRLAQVEVHRQRVAVPRMPACVKGVINLRGKTVPVIDLRLKFGLAEIEPTEQTCIIVVDMGREVGILVDTVSEVLDIAGRDIDPPRIRRQREENDPDTIRRYETLVSPNHTLGTTPSDT